MRNLGIFVRPRERLTNQARTNSYESPAKFYRRGKLFGLKKAKGSLATQLSVTRSDDMLRSLPSLTVSVYSFLIIFHGVLISLVGKCYVCSFFVILSFIHLAMFCMVSHVRLRSSKILNTARFLTTNLTLIDDFYQRAER